MPATTPLPLCAGVVQAGSAGVGFGACDGDGAGSWPAEKIEHGSCCNAGADCKQLIGCMHGVQRDWQGVDCRAVRCSRNSRMRGRGADQPVGELPAAIALPGTACVPSVMPAIMGEGVLAGSVGKRECGSGCPEWGVRSRLGCRTAG